MAGLRGNAWRSTTGEEGNIVIVDFELRARLFEERVYTNPTWTVCSVSGGVGFTGRFAPRESIVRGFATPISVARLEPT
jgi:hypothetical protein